MVIGLPIIRQSLPSLIASLAFIVLFWSSFSFPILIPGVKHFKFGAIFLIILISSGLQITPKRFDSTAILINLLTCSSTLLLKPKLSKSASPKLVKTETPSSFKLISCAARFATLSASSPFRR
jgi:hypothetical protein